MFKTGKNAPEGRFQREAMGNPGNSPQPFGHSGPDVQPGPCWLWLKRWQTDLAVLQQLIWQDERPACSRKTKPSSNGVSRESA